MELILQTNLEHQKRPVEAIADTFGGVRFEEPAQFFQNPAIDFSVAADQLMRNIDEIQRRTEMNVAADMRGRTVPNGVLNIDIKMETGTGKTYVYTNAIYELHKRYGLNKFIVIVPSLPIKAGAAQFLADGYARRHFKDTCGYNAEIDLCLLRAAKAKKGKQFFPSVVRDFVSGGNRNSNKIYVLLMNMALLTNAKVLTRDDYDFGVQGFSSPIEAIKSVRPFVIIDEPHRFEKGQKAYQAIVEKIAPQCIIRFGATFPETSIGRGSNRIVKKDYENLLYNLNACQSFNQNLIKGVAKEHFEPISKKKEKVKITHIESEKATFTYISENGRKTNSLQKGDSLSIISEDLNGLTIDGIGGGKVVFSNGLEKQTGEEFEINAYATSYQEQMLRLALQRHFETERANFNRSSKIKTLALFFIDNIESYRGGWLAKMFEQLLIEQLDTELKNPKNSNAYSDFLTASRADIRACHAGYFAQDNNENDEAIAKEVDDILHNKKELLSFKNSDGKWNTRRFLFSKWTLKEGWDNPNVFTITKLRSSGSENSKLQEVGRGLRLPVDEYGNRISNEEFLLNYIVDFTEADFADRLVAQINEDVPGVQINVLSPNEIERVAALRGVKSLALRCELDEKEYIDGNSGEINQTKLTEFYAEYPEFNNGGVNGSKIINRNKKETNKVKIRKAQFAELQELWARINRKYIIYFSQNVDELIQKNLSKIIAKDVFTMQTITSVRTVLDVHETTMNVIADSGVEYLVQGRKIPYNEFLRRANKITSIPITTLHEAICQYAKTHADIADFITENSLYNLTVKFEEWKCSNLLGNVNYKQANYSSKSTSLTDENGNVRDEIVQGLIGVQFTNGKVSEKYLYDAIAYDSDLERKNILSDVKEIVVYGKIPRRSVAIPTIEDNYSPDFMYVVKKNDGKTELNVIIETKGVEGKQNLRENEKARIECAKKFFEQLKIDGLDVKYETQINNKGIAAIVNELVKEA